MANLDYAFPLTIKYTQRRGTIAFQVQPEGVKILAPRGTGEAEIFALIDQKHAWLSEHWEKAQAKTPQSRRLYQSGETFPFLGQHYPISIIKTDRAGIDIDSGEFCVDLAIGDNRDIQLQCEELFADWLQQQALDYLPQRLEHWSLLTRWQPSSLKIRDYKSRWGSCDRYGRVTLNNRLMMAPELVIDYVVIHELAHLVELNHSAGFWALVEQFCPDYRQHRQWLKKHARELQISADI